MSFLKIKFFPGKVDDYIYFFLSNFIFITLLIIQVYLFLILSLKHNKNEEFLLLIPNSEAGFEEKRDLIFNQLSIENAIISVNKIEEKKIKDLLFKVLKGTKVSNDSIPEVYELYLDNSDDLNLKTLNIKIADIIKGTVIIKTASKRKMITFIFTLIISITSSFILFSHYFMNKNFIFKLQEYLTISRYSGVNEIKIIKNLNLGFLILLIIVFCINYLFFIVILKYYFYDLTNSIFLIEKYLVIIVIYIFLNSTLFSAQLLYNMRKLDTL